MTDMQSRLFDVTPYGGDEPTPAEAKAAKPRQRVELPTEAWVDPWVMIRNRSGVAPYFHLEQSRNTHGAVAAVCGLIGTRITNDGQVRLMVRCPECDMGAQLT